MTSISVGVSSALLGADNKAERPAPAGVVVAAASGVVIGILKRRVPFLVPPLDRR
jgi:hypothetical protein